MSTPSLFYAMKSMYIGYLLWTRGSYECDRLKNKISKYLFRTLGKFSLAMIDIKENNNITGFALNV